MLGEGQSAQLVQRVVGALVVEAAIVGAVLNSQGSLRLLRPDGRPASSRDLDRSAMGTPLG